MFGSSPTPKRSCSSDTGTATSDEKRCKISDCKKVLSDRSFTIDVNDKVAGYFENHRGNAKTDRICRSCYVAISKEVRARKKISLQTE